MRGAVAPGEMVYPVAMTRAASGPCFFAGWLLAWSLTACTREAPQADARQAAPALALASETAFDLTVSQRGALLGWVEGSPGVLHVLRLDERGQRVAAPAATALQGSGVADLALVDTREGVGLIWRVPAEPAEVRGLWLDPAGAASALALGATWAAPGGARGNLALAARGESALALVRGPSEACREAPEAAGAAAEAACFGFRFHQLSARGAQPLGLGLHVPVPCDARAALLLSPPGSADQRYHYAVCTRAEGQTVLTAFSIEPARSYAAAQQVLHGCQPLGAGLFGGQPTFVAECGAARRLARFVDADAPFAVESADVRGLMCSGGSDSRARVRLGSGWLELGAPQAQLELLLDAELSPPGSRAVWTGEALLVARVAGGQLALDRHVCAGKELERQSVALR